MTVPRQGEPVESGRVNQKRRTRAAIVAAAEQLLGEGITPTVAQAAEAAEVSRTTAYRYFPTQESLLAELAVNAGVDGVEEFVRSPLDGQDPGDRLLAVLDLLNRKVLEDEPRNRTALRFYLDMWLEHAANGEDQPVVREGRRRTWITHSLAPFDGELSTDQKRKLTSALSLVAGIEAVVALRDVCRLEPEEALDVTNWAAKALLDTALAERR